MKIFFRARGVNLTPPKPNRVKNAIRDVDSVNFFSSPSPALASPSPSPGTIFESESGKHVASPPSPSPPSPSAAICLTSQQINPKLILSKNFV